MSFEWARSVPRCVVARVARARARARCCSVRWRAVACIVVMAGDPFGGWLTFLTIAHIAAGGPAGDGGRPREGSAGARAAPRGANSERHRRRGGGGAPGGEQG